jgi:hypothetical protein
LELDLISVFGDNVAMVVAAAFIFTVVGIVFCFWGKKLMETFAFIIFGIIGGIIGLLLGLFLAGWLGLVGTVFLAVALGLCLLGIILGVVLSKWLFYALIIAYCAINAFAFALVMLMGNFSMLVTVLIAGVVAIVVAIVLKMFIEKILSAVTAFFGAALVGLSIMLATMAIAWQFFDYKFEMDYYYFILLGVVLGVVIILGIAGTVKQLKGKAAPKRQPQKGRGRRRR